MATGGWKAFDGAALTAASKTGVSAKISGTVSLQPAKSAAPPAAYNPTATYSVKKPAIEPKLPKDKTMENKPIGAPDLAPKIAFKKWDDPALKQHGESLMNAAVTLRGAELKKEDDEHWQVARPAEGKRMIIRAPTAALKSKWAGVTPRPSTANPPKMPTDQKLSAKMKVTLEKSAQAGPFDMVVAKFPAAASVVKWRMELKCAGWQRTIAIMAETPTASFKMACGRSCMSCECMHA